MSYVVFTNVYVIIVGRIGNTHQPPYVHRQHQGAIVVRQRGFFVSGVDIKLVISTLAISLDYLIDKQF